MWRKIAWISAIIVVMIVIAFWSPWKAWNLSWLNFLGIESKDEFASLKVVSLGGDIEVYIDEEYKGTAIFDAGFLEIAPVEPGEHLVTLIRSADNIDSYVEIVRKINFEPAVDVVIGYEIGPSEDFSEGHLLSARKSYAGDSNTYLEVYSLPDGIDVSLDGQFLGKTPIKQFKLDRSAKHKLKFTKDGYDSLEIELLPDLQEERDKLKDLLLTLEVNLFTQPVKIITE